MVADFGDNSFLSHSVTRNTHGVVSVDGLVYGPFDKALYVGLSFSSPYVFEPFFSDIDIPQLICSKTLTILGLFHNY